MTPIHRYWIGASCLLLPFAAHSLAPLISRRQAVRSCGVFPTAVLTGAVLLSPDDAIAMEWQWDDKPKGGFPMLLNGQSNVPTDGSFVRFRYDDASGSIYRSMVVYQKTGTADTSRLDKAVRGDFSVARALDVAERMGDGWVNMRKAQLVASGQYYDDADDTAKAKYYTFDLKYTTLSPDDAPTEVLYYLVSAVVLGERLYAMIVECTEKDWTKSKAALEKLRTSFRVQSLA